MPPPAARPPVDPAAAAAAAAAADAAAEIEAPQMSGHVEGLLLPPTSSTPAMEQQQADPKGDRSLNDLRKSQSARPLVGSGMPRQRGRATARQPALGGWLSPLLAAPQLGSPVFSGDGQGPDCLPHGLKRPWDALAALRT